MTARRPSGSARSQACRTCRRRTYAQGGPVTAGPADRAGPSPCRAPPAGVFDRRSRHMQAVHRVQGNVLEHEGGEFAAAVRAGEPHQQDRRVPAAH